jgi:hypothetical protein
MKLIGKGLNVLAGCLISQKGSYYRYGIPIFKTENESKCSNAEITFVVFRITEEK